jgi:glycosyltransferase involved in cell wall biosynthesis|tara:strand:- start:122 stop:1093 length:972 start_codon:yes stop_codon:yes gene_type:complete
LTKILILDVSVVIPLYNEKESLIELYDWIYSNFKMSKYSFEVIFIDDGSNDESWKIICELIKKSNNVRGISLVKNYGKSQALNAGFKHAKGNLIATLDADLQDSPDELIPMIEMLKKENLDIVSGWKKIRHDNLFLKNLPSKLFNFSARAISGIKLHDFNCGIKVYKKNVIKSINVSGEMHRYIPFLASQAGFKKISEKEVKHQKRKYGVTKFGSERFINGFLDLLTLWFLDKFGKRPMHFFGLIGSLMFSVGLIFTIYLGIDKIYFNTNSRLITERPQFFIALTTIIIGVQFFISGFIGELLLRQRRNSDKDYTISQIIPSD